MEKVGDDSSNSSESRVSNVSKASNEENTENVAGNDEKYVEVTRKSSSNELQDLMEQVTDLSKRITEKDFKFHQLSQRLNDYENESLRQRRLNESLTQTVMKLRNEITSNTQEYEEEVTRIEQEKQHQFEIHSKEAEQMRKDIALGKEQIAIKEKIIPGLLQELENKNIVIDQTTEYLASSVDDIRKLESELEILKEERNSLTEELQRSICDYGNATNELHEVLRLRDKMAKEFVAYRMDGDKIIEALKEGMRQKDDVIEALLRQIESFKPNMASIPLQESLQENEQVDLLLNWENNIEIIMNELRPWKTTAAVATGGVIIGGLAVVLGSHYVCS